MSAYALPGSFFPPLPFIGSASSSNKSDESSSPPKLTSSSSSRFWPFSSDADTNTEKKREALHKDTDVSHSTSRTVDEQSSENNTTSELGIAIKSAKIDPVRLVRAVMRAPKTAPRNNAQERSPKPLSSETKESLPCNVNRSLRASYEEDESDSDDDDYDYDYNQSSSDRQYTNNNTALGPSIESPVSSQEAHETDAIEFELSICFNGRKYTATRTLPSFVKLRDELMRELRKKSSPCKHGKRDMMSNTQIEGNSSTSRTRQSLAEVSLNNAPQTIGEESESHRDSQINLEEEMEIREIFIPELPIGSSQSAVDGSSSSLSEFAKEELLAVGGSALAFGRAGFSMLQSMMGSYCPAMECWLRQVADIVPPSSSPILTKFLWEPLTTTKSGNAVSRNREPSKSSMYAGKRSSMKSFATLDSINEDDYDCEDVDEADHDEACIF
jgi:hypothetical protein